LRRCRRFVRLAFELEREDEGEDSHNRVERETNFSNVEAVLSEIREINNDRESVKTNFDERRFRRSKG